MIALGKRETVSLISLEYSKSNFNISITGPHSAVGSAWRLIIKEFPRSFSSADSRRVVVSYKRKYVHKVLVNHLVKLAQEKNVVR